MKKFVLTFVLSITSLFGAALCAEDGGVPRSCTPFTNDNPPEWWHGRREAVNRRLEQGNVDLLLIGDSVTHHWDYDGVPARDYYFGDRNCVNMGFGGDQTGNVLWRLNDSPMDKIHPKAAMLLIGANNLWPACNQNPADVARGTKMIVEKLESLYPDIKILVLYTFPVGESGENPMRSRIARSNAALLDLLGSDPHVTLKDISYIWVDESNRIPAELMGDFAHPTEQGFWLWGAAIEPEIAKMLGTEPKQAP